MAFGGGRRGSISDKINEKEEFQNEPLDVITVQVTNKHGITKRVSALHIGFMQCREYVLYKVLPSLILPDIAKCSKADEEEWMYRMSLFESDLMWLLKLPHSRFWSQVVYDDKLQMSLQSYLSRAPRAYELNTNARKEILVQQRKVHRCIYKVFLRMATFKESKKYHITPHIFGDIIYENFLFDIPRMMDLCVLFGFHNQQILTRMLQNCFMHQPQYYEDLNNATPTILKAFESIEDKLKPSSSQRRLNCAESALSCASCEDFLDVVNAVVDASATLSIFLDCFPQGCNAFHKENATMRIPSFYELVIPQLEMELLQRESGDDDDSPKNSITLDVIRQKLILSKTFLVRIFRSITAYCLIQPILDSKCNPESCSGNDCMQHLESFVEVFTELASGKTFLADYNQIFPFESEVEMFYEIGISIDAASLSYILSSVGATKEMAKGAKTLENGDASSSAINNGTNAVASLHSVGASFATCSNLVNGAGGSSNGGAGGSSNSYGYAVAGATPAKPSEAEIASLTQAILDVLPDLGEGFVEECLDYYNYETEPVVDAILSQSLPERLDKMDRCMKKQICFDSKLIEKHQESSVLQERKSIFDYDEFDVFNRDDVDMSKIHVGKRNKTKNMFEEKSFDEIKALTLKFEEQLEVKSEADEKYMYEDEYDDTYDSHFVNVAEAQPENELLKVRPIVTPIALRSFKKGGFEAPEEEEEQEVEEDDDQNDKPQQENERYGGNNFCMNPEVLRDQARQRYESKQSSYRRNDQHRPSSDASTSSSSQPNMKSKERHKGQVANHNRRKQSDFKKSRGMFS